MNSRVLRCVIIIASSTGEKAQSKSCALRGGPYPIVLAPLYSYVDPSAGCGSLRLFWLAMSLCDGAGVIESEEIRCLSLTQRQTTALPPQLNQDSLE